MEASRIVAQDVVAPGGLIAKKTLEARFQAFARGEWVQLLRVSSQCDEKAAVSRRRQGRRRGHEVERRVARAETLIHLGELSSARQALEGSELVPGNHGNSRHFERPKTSPSSASGTIASTNDGFPAGGAVSVGPADVWKEFEVFQKGCGWGSFRNDDRALQTIALRWQGHEDVVPFGGEFR